jgi:negative regulator of sigma-B (phosphoserine phosphatase)
MMQLAIETDADVEAARHATRAAAVAAGLPADATADFADFAGQAAAALILHGQGRGGELCLREVERRVAGAAVCGVELCVACEDRPLTPIDLDRGGPLLNLPSSPLADEVDVDLRIGEGLRLRARRFVTPQERRSEVAVLGRPAPGEHVSGDDAAFLRLPDRLVLCVADGLGKGAPAREASHRAVACLATDEGAASDDPAQLLAFADLALQGTRGAVMAAASHPFGGGTLRHACAGDTTTMVATAKGQRRLFCASHVLGTLPQRRRPFPAEEIQAQPGALIIMYTDGLVSRIALPEQPAFLLQHPLRVASYLLSRFTRGHDDALVLVSRL